MRRTPTTIPAARRWAHCPWAVAILIVVLSVGQKALAVSTESGVASIIRARGQATAAEAPAKSASAAAAAAISGFAGTLNPLEEQLFADAADGRLDEHSLLSAALIASGVDDFTALEQCEARMAALVEELRESGKVAGSPRQKAEILFDFMHRRILSGGYRIECTDLGLALERGWYNCVSASVLFDCLAGEFGLSACGLESPGHATSRLRLPEGNVDVETTCPRWFRLSADPKRQAEHVEKTLGTVPSKDRSQAREVSPVELTAMIYYNRGVDLLAAKQFAAAAAANAKALRLDSASVTARGNLLATVNNWAISLGASQRFAEAADLLRRGRTIEPGFETFTLNYVHLHHQWTQHLCNAGRFDEALGLLARAAAEYPAENYFRQAPIDVNRRRAEEARQ